VEIEIEADYTPPTPDVHYLRNGDPGHPGEPEEVEFLSVTIDGEDTKLTEEEQERAIVRVCEAAADYDPTE
jgi:hypothetical protein